MNRGEFSLTAIVLLLTGIGVGVAVYVNQRLGLAIVAAVAVVTLTYTLLRKTDGKNEGDDSLNGESGGSATPGNTAATASNPCPACPLTGSSARTSAASRRSAQ